MRFPPPARSVSIEVHKHCGIGVIAKRVRPPSKLWRLVWAVALLWGAAGPAVVWACEGPAAKLVSIEGLVEVRVAGGNAWSAAQPAQMLCTGDTLAVRSLGRAAVVLPNDVVLRLDQGSVLTLQAFAPDKASELGLVQGALHVLTRFTKRFGVITPYLNAMVDGTEFTVRVIDGATHVSVTEGQVLAENRAGELKLSAGLSVRAAAGQAPVALNLRPADAVQWALFFPQIVYPGTAALRSLSPLERAAAELAKQGRYADALSAWPAQADATLRSTRAGWLLGVGRVEASQALLDREAASALPDAASMAVRAVIQVVRNQAAEALATAQQAVALAPLAAAPELALSYAHQAQRDLPLALAAAQRAVQREPEHALAWARLAELQLSSGLLRDGEGSARQAVSLNAHTPRAQTLLGFGQLLRGRDADAAASLQAAQMASPGDPLPHLGLGLLNLRAGRLAQGRSEFEVAVMLDPGNAELRAVLARAYFGESRDRLAEDELQLSRGLDPLSPTPWFVDGLRKQRAQRLVEASADYQRAIALNDQRAVVRPNSLLDTDRASRTAALASVWRELGFEGALLAAARGALAEDPQNEAAHRLLAQAYATAPRYETARVSELLQAQLRQSPRTEPAAPQELIPGWPVLNGPRTLSLQESSPLFDEKRSGARLGLMSGNVGLLGTAATAWHGIDNGQVSFGHFRYETDGFRPGAHLQLDANNLLWQTALTPELSGQIEFRSARQEGGDITQRLVPESAAPERQRTYETRAVRLGTRFAPSPDREWLGSVIWLSKDALSRDITRANRLTVTATGVNDRSAQLAELIYSKRISAGWALVGVSNYREDAEISSTVTTVPAIRPPLVRSSSPLLQHDQAFAYCTLGSRPITGYLGLSRDDLSQNAIAVHETSPKLGLSWALSDRLRLRAAVFRSVKGSSAKEQSIEPTQFAGFNQVFDDSTGTRSQRKALAFDQALGMRGHWGAEWSARALQVPTTASTPISGCLGPVCNVRWRESANQIQGNLLIDRSWALGMALRYENQSLQTAGAVVSVPSQTRTWQLPLTATYGASSTWSFQGRVTAVHQSVALTSGPVRSAKEDFWIADAGVRYRLSQRSRLLADVTNFFDQDFRFQDTYLSGEARLPLFQPRRTIMVRAEVAF